MSDQRANAGEIRTPPEVDNPPSPPPRPWKSWIAALGVATLLLCGAAAVANGSSRTFIDAMLFGGLPACCIIAVFVVLGNAGKRARTFCGYCGYDRTGFGPQALCPECGKDARALNAPGHKAVGHRTLPMWIWIPIILAFPSLLVLVPLTGGRYIGELMTGVVAFIGLMLLLAGWNAWNQGRSPP